MGCKVLDSLVLQPCIGVACIAGMGSAEQCNDDVACLTMASMDRQGLEAIRSLHRQLDDDANGAVDLSESDEVRSLIWQFVL